jgi:hypothetical protein
MASTFSSITTRLTFQGFAQAAGRQALLPPWAWILIIIVLVSVVAWAIIRNIDRGAIFSTNHKDPHPVEDEAGKPTAVDDLKIIEGVGPKISAILEAAGIQTLDQLAKTAANELEQILRDAGLRLGDPTTWPEQAKLAAAGDWEALTQLQDQLTAGRRE